MLRLLGVLVPLLLLLLLLPQQTAGSSAALEKQEKGRHPNVSYRPICKVDAEIVGIARDPATGTYSRLSLEDEEGSDDGRRRLMMREDYDNVDSPPSSLLRGTVDLAPERLYSIRNWSPGIQVSSSNVEDTPDGTVLFSDRKLDAQQVEYVRACNCFDYGPIFCPLDVDHCGMIRRYNATLHGPVRVGCLDRRGTMDEFAETAFLISFLWFSLLFSCICCTQWGRNFLHFLLSQCIPGYNKMLAWFILRTNRDRARDMIHSHLDSRRLIILERLERLREEVQVQVVAVGSDETRTDNGDETSRSRPKGPATSLALSTRIFRTNVADHPSTHKDDFSELHVIGDDQEDDDIENQCIICFQNIQDGERVSDLSCCHTFHADCLKTWLKRKNACPLCNKSEIAVPRYSENTLTKDSSDAASEARQRILTEASSRNGEIMSAGGDMQHPM